MEPTDSDFRIHTPIIDDDAQLEIARAILETLPDELSDKDKKQIAAEIAVMVSEDMEEGDEQGT